LFGIILLVLILPSAQRFVGIWKWQDLHGSHSNTSKPMLTFQTWFDASFQDQFDDYFNDSFGLSPPLVRMVNQLDFSLYNQPNARYVVVGKSNCLYETAYIEAHLGMDFLGQDSIQQLSRKLAEVSSYLMERGTRLLFVFAPGKGSFYPEFIPAYYLQYSKPQTNYQAFKSSFISEGIDIVDFNAWFRAMKTSCKYPLYSKVGIHWSAYGMSLAADSLLTYLGKTHQKILPSWSFTLSQPTPQLQKSDDDVEKGMNLLFDLPHQSMAYPSIQIIDSNRQKLKTAVIADSYFWGLYDDGFCTKACDQGEFWYYNKQVYPKFFETGLTTDLLDLKKALLEKDVIIILQTDATLNRIGFGFIEDAYKTLISDQ
jgi:hypothetical protein